MKTNEILQMNITSMSGEGEGIARYDGMVIFVKGVVSGELVNARITEVKKNFARAEIMDIIQPSALRIEAACPEFAACGGCSLQILSYKDQLELKRNYVAEVLRRIGKTPVSVLKINSFEPYHYRNRVQWHCQDGKLGFYNQSSHNLAVCDSCLLLPQVFNEIQTFLNQQKLPVSLCHFTLQANEDTSLLMAVFCAEASCSRKEQQEYRKLAELLSMRFPELCSCFLNLSDRNNMLYGKDFVLLYGENHLPVNICGKKFLLYPSAFLQVNFAGCEALYNKVLEWADLCGGETIWDIYCGIGTISLLLAEKAARVTGIEYCAPAIEAAKVNAKLNNSANYSFLCGRAEDILPHEVKNGKKADLAVLDPPRAGCAPQVIDALISAAPERIIYVSCNPATLARDLKLLQENYELQRIECFDLFPQTVHCETIALLNRKQEDKQK
ncbi:MAG: 23S rRNA (uracil(1939)-C(5))-methyltransferase RlmD [Firmicutes bacterium]|nr:23S rRNA (uracil(1939)-C(5))-methyltransferase RlmD [Bacillota bacterium]